jgi:predicted mannosyl-3-phosphoglycerate phosphatase (HAD superfamily)
MARAPVPVVVFVDADAAPPAPAVGDPNRHAAALEMLAARRITIVLCSHRTRAEVEGVRQALGLFHPFVCERGAAAYVPERYFGTDLENTRKVGGYEAIEFGEPYENVVDTLRRASHRLAIPLVGFEGLSVEQAARECSLPLLDARLAKLREYTEPFRLVSPNPVAERRLFKALESAGLTCTSYGDFHCAGSTSGAGSAAAVLTTLYRIALGTIAVAAAGDAAWSAQIGGRLDLTLPPPVGAPTEWLDSIITDVDSFREAALAARPVARYAR